ncbi:MAG: glycosyltransferase family 2 protein [Paracoccaceae bacterium]
MSGPLISVITVTRNLIEDGRRDSIRSALDCVQAQTCRDIEHVVWDGESTDGTQDLLEGLVAQIQGQPDHITLKYICASDKSIYDAMNQAAEASRGKYVIFLNSDDLLAAPDCLEAAAAALRARPVDYLVGETLYDLESGERQHARKTTLKGMLQSMPFCHNSVLFDRVALQRFGGHDTRFRIAADYDLLLRMILANCPGAELPTPLALFRRGGISTDVETAKAEMRVSWRNNFQPYCDMTGYSDEEMQGWMRKGQLPLRLSLALYGASKGNPALRRAASYSLIKTVRRRLQPWRRWG